MFLIFSVAMLSSIILALWRNVFWKSTRSFVLNLGVGGLEDGLDVPDLSGVLGDGAVARKFSDAGNIQDSLTCPHRGVFERLSNPFLGCDIRLQIGQMEVRVPPVQDRLVNPAKQARLVRTKQVGNKRIHESSHVGTTMIILSRMIRPALTHPPDLLDL